MEICGFEDIKIYTYTYISSTVRKHDGETEVSANTEKAICRVAGKPRQPRARVNSSLSTDPNARNLCHGSNICPSASTFLPETGKECIFSAAVTQHLPVRDAKEGIGLQTRA